MRRLLALLLLVGAPAYAATPTLVQHTSSAYNRIGTGDDTVNGMKFTFPSAVLAGNCLVVGINYPYSATRTISLADTNGTWGSPAITTSDTTLGVSMSIFVLPNATAGIHTITVTFDAALIPVQYRASEFYNVATTTPVDGSHGNAAATAPNVDAGSLSASTNNDANGGHLVWAMFADRDWPAAGVSAMTGFTPGTSFSLLDADRIPQNNPVISMPNASEYRVVSTFATFPLTPGITASGHTDDYIGCAVALKAAAAGTAPAAGIRIIRLLHQSHDSPPASFAMQAPMDGNLMVLVTSEQQTVVVSGVTDNHGNSYTQYEDSDTSVPQFWVAKNVTPQNDLTITISQTGSAGRSYTLYDITGADTVAPVDGTAHTTAFTNSTGANITDTPVLTPASANGLTIAAGSNGLGPTSGLDTGAPAGAVFDFVYYTAETDNSNMDNADMRAHAYNSSLTAQHWNWVTANGSQSTSQSAMAVHFASAAGGVAQILPQQSLLLALPVLPPPAITLGPAQLNMVRALVPFAAVDLAVTFDIAAEWLTTQTILVCQGVADVPFDVVVLDQRVRATTLHAIRSLQANDAATVQCIGGNPQ